MAYSEWQIVILKYKNNMKKITRKTKANWRTS